MTAFGASSPVKTFAPTLYLDVNMDAGARFDLPVLADELAVYSVDSDISIDGEPVAAHTLALLAPDAASIITTGQPARLMIIGGAALEQPRLIWWNFVSSRKERIAQAGSDWQAQKMGQVAGETEFIPLPERRPVERQSLV